jgi:hypothetical protein
MLQVGAGVKLQGWCKYCRGSHLEGPPGDRANWVSFLEDERFRWAGNGVERDWRGSGAQEVSGVDGGQDRPVLGELWVRPGQRTYPELSCSVETPAGPELEG